MISNILDRDRGPGRYPVHRIPQLKLGARSDGLETQQRRRNRRGRAAPPRTRPRLAG